MVRTAEDIREEIARLLKRLADPVTAGESVKACIRRASMRAGLNYGQAKRLWYRETRNIPAFMADAIRERAIEHDRKLKRQMVEAISIMQATDPEFYRDVIEAAGAALLPGGKRSGASSGKG